MKYGLVLLLCAASSGAVAQIYKWTDASGQVQYSNLPPPGQTAGAVDWHPAQLGEAAPAKAPETPASTGNRPAPPKSAAQASKKIPPQAPRSLSGGKSDESDEARCNFARDILSGAVQRVGRRGPIDDDDRAVARNDVQMFCR